MIWLIACVSKNSEPVENLPVVEVKQEVAKLQVHKTTVNLDGIEIEVKWDDGDTFHGVHPDGRKIKARLNAYNTLESYGPVHQWGDWTSAEFYKIAKDSGVFASKTTWECMDTQQGGGYGRLLVDCPELRKQMLEQGYAHPFSMDGPAPATDLNALNIGIQNRAGIWAKGTPSVLITSLHSQDEKPQDAYNRVCDMQTGECGKRVHTETYEVCQNVCIEDSCMVYVPYKSRYGDGKADCLR